MRNNHDLRNAVSDRRDCLIRCTAIFFASILIMLVSAKLRSGDFMYQSQDGMLYVSIADNLLDNGHFQQTARYWRENMVVPFGLPVLLIPLRIISRSLVPIIIAQMTMFGLCAVMAYLSERNFFNSSGLFSLGYFLLASAYRCEGSAIVIAGVEGWYLFLLYSMLYTLSHPRISEKHRLTLLNILGFWAMAIRPMLAPIYIIILCYTIWRAFKRTISIPRICTLTITPAVVLFLFSLINLRESGEWVLFQNYASIDMCAVNNPTSTPEAFDIVDVYSVVEDSIGMDYARDDAMYKQRFAEYVRNYPLKFLKDSAVHFYKMYVEHWVFAIIPVTACAIMLRKLRKHLFLYMYIIILVLAIVASTGMLEHRYTVYTIPCWGILLAGGYSMLKERGFFQTKKLWNNKIMKQRIY